MLYEGIFSFFCSFDGSKVFTQANCTIFYAEKNVMSKLIKANTLPYLIVAKQLYLKQNILILSKLFAHSVLKHNGYIWIYKNCLK